MRYKYTYKHKETGVEYRYDDLRALFAANRDDGRTFEEFIEQDFIEQITPILTPQERRRAAVYATGNKWAIENFNATHN